MSKRGFPEYEYFRVFECEPEPRRKTRRYLIRSRRDDSHLGTIQWYGAWRQFVFIPVADEVADTVWSTGCLRDVIDAIEWIADKRRRERANA